MVPQRMGLQTVRLKTKLYQSITHKSIRGLKNVIFL